MGIIRGSKIWYYPNLRPLHNSSVHVRIADIHTLVTPDIYTLVTPDITGTTGSDTRFSEFVVVH